MATVVPIAGGPETAKIRSVFAPALLPYVTFGIYSLVWYYKINRELADLGRKNGRQDLGTSPGLSLLAITLGCILIVPPILSIIGTYKRLKQAQQLVGVPEAQQANPWIFGILWVFVGIIGVGYCQNELNKVWTLQAGGSIAPAAGATSFTKA